MITASSYYTWTPSVLAIVNFILIVLVIGMIFFLKKRYEIRVTNKELVRLHHESRMVEARKVHSQKLESLGRMSAGVAHDFNNVLGVILTHVQLAENASLQYERYNVPGHEQIQHDLGVIEEAANQAAEYVKQLIVFSRNEPTNPQPTIVREVVQKIDSMLRGHLASNIKFVTEWSRDEEPWPVFIDPSRLSQVLMNLVLNANDAMPNGGTLKLTMKKTIHDGLKELDGAMPHGRYVKLTVQDEGTGIPEEHVDHIFEPFYTSKPQGIGSGLGLATVYGIVTQAGGYINVTTMEGFGTRFDIYLPVVT